MASEQRVRHRIGEHPRSVPGVLGGVVVTIGLAVALRVLIGSVLNDTVFPITYLALIGGGLGATAMFVVHEYVNEARFPPIDFWANVLGNGDAMAYRRQGLYLHVTYGAVLGSFYPRLVQELATGGAGNLFAALPLSLVTASVYSLVLFLLALVYARIGLFRLSFDRRAVGGLLATHVVYGLVLGLTAGLMKPMIGPLLGL